MKSRRQKPMQKKRTNSLILSDLEISLFSKGATHIVGIDEVGRGCMAGPMVITGYVLEAGQKILDGINDSKKLSKKNRVELSPILSKDKHLTVEISANEIDENGLTAGFKKAVSKIYQMFNNETTAFLVDGNTNFSEYKNIFSVINGDATIYSIASSSIIAKVYRDRLMTECATKYPEYGFATHVGYCTKQHISAVEQYGVLPIHRKSYGPIRKLRVGS